MRDWGGKLVGTMLRIATLFHIVECADNPCEKAIKRDVIQRAIDIAECIAKHAESAYQVMGTNEKYNEATYVLKRIQTSGQHIISKRDLYHLCKGHYRFTEELDIPLKILSEMNYIKMKEIKSGSKGGRPSIEITLNPQIKIRDDSEI
jgi:hypothetical protein